MNTLLQLTAPPVLGAFIGYMTNYVAIKMLFRPLRPWKIFGEGPLEVKDGRQGENHENYSQADIRFTTKEGVLYAYVMAPPTEDIVIKTLAAGGELNSEIGKIELMGSKEKIRWKRSEEGLTIKLPKTLPGEIVNGFRIRIAN